MKKITTLLSIFLALTAFAAKPVDNSPLKVGILSDVHISNGENSDQTFIKALEYFRDNDVDAVMIAGDMIEMGVEPQLKTVAESWYYVFPKDKGRKGRHVEKLFVYGNHEINGHKFKKASKAYTPEELEAIAINPRRAELWEKYFKEKFEPIYMKEIKGYKFIGAHFQNVKNVPGLEEFFESVSSTLPTDKPFFYFQHTHPKGTCSTNKVWGQDDGTSTSILSRYPNVICFSGHSHTTITDERTIWQGAFTSIGTGSLRQVNLLGTDHENGKIEKGANSQMYKLNCSDGQQGQLMTVYPDRIELLRHDFKYDEDLGVWTIPVDTNLRPYSYEAREESSEAPQFEEGAKVKTFVKADGRDRKKNTVAQIWLRFPSVAAKGSAPRAWDFQVDVEVMDGDTPTVYASKKVFAKGCYLGEKKDLEMGSLCVYAMDELPSAVPFRFAIYPMNCFGKKGTPIYSKELKNE